MLIGLMGGAYRIDITNMMLRAKRFVTVHDTLPSVVQMNFPLFVRHYREKHTPRVLFNFRLPTRCKCGLRSSVMLNSIDC